MAEETVDLIEETKDEMENWLYYTKEIKAGENTNINEFNVVKPEQQLIYMDSTDLAANDNEQLFQYDCDDLVNEEQDIRHNAEDNAEQLHPQHLENDEDLSKHNLILKETIDENGQLVEGFFCQECNLCFSTIEDFLNYHPTLELLNANSEQQDQQQQQQSPENETSVPEDKLWELVENLDEASDDNDNKEVIETKLNIANSVNEINVSSKSIELDEERYFCYDCQQVFTDLTTAENHDCINVYRCEFYRCDLCDKGYTTLRTFNNHQRWHKKSEQLSCQTKPIDSETVVCELCNTIFASKKNLKLHMKMHKKQSVRTIQDALPAGAQSEYNDLNQFFCEICNKSFDQKLLAIHKNMHQNLEEYSCGKCNKQFENLPSYEIHMQMHVDNFTNAKKSTTSKNSNNLTPTAKEATLASSSSADRSKRKHVCQYCGKDFQRPYEKVKHERIHTGEKPYECEVCGKSFRVSYSLTLHLRTHTDIRPYVCATCNKRFKQQSVYVHHLKTHVVERAYKCDICGKSFRTSVQLIGHKNIHSKPYNCPECNRPFASLYSVKIHMKTHNKGHKANKNLKNRCSLCGATYARIFALRLHLKEQHGLDVYPTQLLVATCANAYSTQKDSKRTTLINDGRELTNMQMHFSNTDNNEDDPSDEDKCIVTEGIFSQQVDHEENIQNSFLTHNCYLDETEAATQTILNTEEISANHFIAEEIITD